MMSSSPPPNSSHNSNNQPQNQFNFLLSSPQTFIGDFQYNDFNPILLSDEYNDSNTQGNNLDFYTTTTSNLNFDSNSSNSTLQQHQNLLPHQNQQPFIDNVDFIQMGQLDNQQQQQFTTVDNNNNNNQPQSQHITPSSSSSSTQIKKSFSNHSIPPQMIFQPQSPQQHFQQQIQPVQNQFLTPLRLNHKRNKSKLIEKSPLNVSGNPFYIPNQASSSMVSPKIQKRSHRKTTSVSNSISFTHLDHDLNLNLNSPLDNSPRLKVDDEDDDDIDSNYVIPTLIEKNSLSNLQLPLNTLIEDKLDTNISSIYLPQQQQQQQSASSSSNGEFNYLMNDHLQKNPSPLETISNSRRIQRSKSNFNLSDIAITRSRSSSSVQAPTPTLQMQAHAQQQQQQQQQPPPLPNQFIHPNALRQQQLAAAPPSQFDFIQSSHSSLPIITPPGSSNIHIIDTNSPKRRTRRSTTSGGSTPSSSSTSTSSNIKFPERLDLPHQSARSKSRSKKGGLNENKKIHECPLCSMKFQRPEHVKRHMLSHSSEKPFLCPELNCGKRFNRNDNLKQHLRNIHKRKI